MASGAANGQTEAMKPYTGLLAIDFPWPGQAQVFDPLGEPHAQVATMRGFNCSCARDWIDEGTAVLFMKKIYFYAGELRLALFA